MTLFADLGALELLRHFIYSLQYFHPVESMSRSGCLAQDVQGCFAPFLLLFTIGFIESFSWRESHDSQ